MDNRDIRWKQRFENYEKAFVLLDEVIQRDMNSLSALEMEGLVQRFEITVELAWKTLKDYLEYEGYDGVKNGKQAIRQGFQDGIIHHAEAWMSALEKRNLTSHTYNEYILHEMLHFIFEEFHPIARDLYLQLKQQL